MSDSILGEEEFMRSIIRKSVAYYCKCSGNEAYNLLYGQCVGV